MILESGSAPVGTLTPYVSNPRRGNLKVIKESLRENGQYRSIVVNRGTRTGRPNEILAGNHTWMAARELDWQAIEVDWVDVDNDRAARIVAVDNRANDLAEYDNDDLASLLQGLPDLAGTGYDDDDLAALLGETEQAGPPTENASLAERFGAPPLSVLNAREGAWQARKRSWIDLGIQSEVGRDGALVFQQPESMYVNWYQVKNRAEEETGRKFANRDLIEDPKYGAMLDAPGNGTSVFDPALCELIYRWFSGPGQHIIDPWAGGSVRGIVAGTMGRAYTGVELRGEQVAANRGQAHLVSEAGGYSLAERVEPEWIEGDSTTMLRTLPDATYDMAIGCPPYYDLEVYSDDPADMSNMSHADFDRAMMANMFEVGRVLRDDSFAVFVVGAVRDKKGRILDMRRIMTDAAAAAGMYLFNDAILLTPIGSAAARAASGFNNTRVLTRVHQEVLVYVKGDRKKAAKRAGVVDVTAEVATIPTDEDAE